MFIFWHSSFLLTPKYVFLPSLFSLPARSVNALLTVAILSTPHDQPLAVETIDTALIRERSEYIKS